MASESVPDINYDDIDPPGFVSILPDGVDLNFGDIFTSSSSSSTRPHIQFPTTSSEPFDFLFDYGDIAWACDNHGLWRRVLVVSNGHWQGVNSSRTRGRGRSLVSDGKTYKYYFCKDRTVSESSSPETTPSKRSRLSSRSKLKSKSKHGTYTGKRKPYAPMLGELKPDFPFIRTLLYEEGVIQWASEEEEAEFERERIDFGMPLYEQYDQAK